ncbi:MAG TPA: hypothetical protein VHI52_21270 [Verrucomicrobiae bacterium]|nr:hypothetical protein [Verrucomicrobiae bacterium]
MSNISKATARDRAVQTVLILSTLTISWLGMMVVHEFGHVVFGWLGGGIVARVVLSPLEFSRTEMQKNPHPLFEAWGGALVGSILPLLIALVFRRFRLPAWYVFQFFAGLCLITNGIYLAVVSFIPNAADPGDLMRNGSPQWILVVFGIITFPLGLFLWNGLGVHFGLGDARGKVNGRVAIAVFALLVALVLVEAVTYTG